jgi:signal transduction histidine kinase
MLTHESIEAGKYTIFPETLPAVATVESIMKNIKSVGRAKNIKLVVVNELSNEETESVVIQADAPKLEQAFLNIASNSIKFSPDNSELKIIISKTSSITSPESLVADAYPFPCTQCLAYAGALTVSFVDNGVGIEPENLSKLFGEFMQFDPEKLQGGGGTGLGLYITRNIVKSHNGVIDVFSDGIGRGTCFALKLPSYTCCDVNPLRDAHNVLSQGKVPHSLLKSLSNLIRIVNAQVPIEMHSLEQLEGL